MRRLTTTGRIRGWLACYGAVVAILVEQLSSAPRSNVSPNPNPLVRIREGAYSDRDWHPDEILTSRDGRRSVLVLGSDSLGIADKSENLLKN